MPETDTIRDFYSHVIGGKSPPVPIGGYEDYSMNSPEHGDPMAGVCHARGSDVPLSPVRMIYVNVEDIDASVSRCLALGGKLNRDSLDGNYGPLLRRTGSCRGRAIAFRTSALTRTFDDSNCFERCISVRTPESRFGDIFLLDRRFFLSCERYVSSSAHISV
ncbi:MAG: hypothetical protein IH951_03055 [Bacteroidetes bacterium]|nr:hypothetical protein [Bacteroidota bacterium]